MNRSERGRFWTGRGGLWLASLVTLAGLAAWLWPYGFGGRMPVGGDVTQFFLGLMAFYQSEICAGRLPVWNDLWGFGFPGLAESQMGVYYPPHWLLYRFLSLELAYTVSMVLHTFWAGLGASWAARRFGASTWASVLAGFAWAASGFFLIHLPHQWAYTVGSWMPWALGLGWVWLSGQGCWRTPWLLALVLAIQVLPGHFQLAFETQVALLCMGLWSLVERPGGLRAALGRFGILLVAMAAVLPLDAMQLWPTWKLAQLAERQRDFEYLSGFAATPLHLVSYVAPGLFHFSPLWRPLAWDVFHTSPEEHLVYIGLVPLFLACGALRYGLRRERETRLLLVLVLISLFLSLGPYVPGFRLLIQLPGFSWFRAPARWGLVTELALCLLAARGFDALATWPRVGRSTARFVGVAVLGPLVLIGLVELVIVSHSRPTKQRGWLQVPIHRALGFLPWRDGQTPGQIAGFVTGSQGHDQRVASGMAREGFEVAPAYYSFPRARWEIYRRELQATGLLMAALVMAPLVLRRAPRLQVGFVFLTVVDLIALGRHRTIDDGPIRPLTEQSRVLARLGQQPRGSRVAQIQGISNLPMAAATATLNAYRSLNVPDGSDLVRAACWPLPHHASVKDMTASLQRALAVAVVLDDFQSFVALMSPEPSFESQENIELIDDPALAAWRYGADWVATPQGRQAQRFRLRRNAAPRSAAWLANHTVEQLERPRAWVGSTDRFRLVWDRIVADTYRDATRATVRRLSPRELEIELTATRPAALIVSQLDYPGWQARLKGPTGAQPVPIQKVFESWQAVDVPEPGTWTLSLEYRAPDAWQGLTVSAIAWLLGLIGFLGQWRLASKRQATRTQQRVEQRANDNDERGDRGSVGIHGAGAGDSSPASSGGEHQGGDVAAG